MIRQFGIHGFSRKSLFSSFDRIFNWGIFRFVLGALAILIVAAVLITFSGTSKFKKIFPQKDPYQLVKLSREREDLYNRLEKGEESHALFLKLTESAFLYGEIHEAEYFLGKCIKDESSTTDLRGKINSFKNLKSKLDKYLYEDGRYFSAELKYPGAYGLIDEILELCETGKIHVRHLFLKGYLLLREGRRTEARIIFENLKKNSGELAPTSLYLYGKTFMLDMDKSAGIEPLKQFITEYKDSRLAALASLNLAKIYNSQTKPNDAVDIIDMAINLNPTSEYVPELMLEKEQSLLLLGKDNKVLLNEIFRKFPESNVVFSKSDEIYKDFTEKKIGLNEKELLLNAANVLIQNGRYFQSKNLLNALLPTLKKQELAYGRYLLALRNYRARELDAALRECNNALKAESDIDLKSRIYKLMGDIYGSKKDVASSEKFYLKATDVKGAVSDDALRQIATVAYDNGWRAKAWNYYEKLVKLFPNSKYLSEASNYLVVMALYNNDLKSMEKYSSILKEKGTKFEDRLKGEYLLERIGKNSGEYRHDHPLAYYSFIIDSYDTVMYLPPEKAYPSVNKFKSNLAWEYFLAGCYDLAEKEYQFRKLREVEYKYVSDEIDPYEKMVLCYTAYFHKSFTDGIIMTRDFMDGNFQASVEKGYMKQFYRKAYPMDYVDIIEKYAPQKGFQTSLILAIIRQESFFNPKVRSSSNAIGLMQILPSTGRWIYQNNRNTGKFDSSKLTNPEYNIENGVWYLDYLREVAGDESGMILAGHNAGPGNLKKWKNMFPVYDSDKYLFYELIPSRQTRNFIKYVLTNQRIYEILYKTSGEDIYF